MSREDDLLSKLSGQLKPINEGRPEPVKLRKSESDVYHNATILSSGSAPIEDVIKYVEAEGYEYDPSKVRMDYEPANISTPLGNKIDAVVSNMEQLKARGAPKDVLDRFAYASGYSPFEIKNYLAPREAGTGEYSWNQFKKGTAGIVGIPAQLSSTGYSPGQAAINAHMGVKDLDPATDTARFWGKAAELTPGMLPFYGKAGVAAKSARELGELVAVHGFSALGGAAAEDSGPGWEALGLLGGGALGGYGASRAGPLTSGLKSLGSKIKAHNPFSDKGREATKQAGETLAGKAETTFKPIIINNAERDVAKDVIKMNESYPISEANILQAKARLKTVNEIVARERGWTPETGVPVDDFLQGQNILPARLSMAEESGNEGLLAMRRSIVNSSPQEANLLRATEDAVRKTLDEAAASLSKGANQKVIKRELRESLEFDRQLALRDLATLEAEQSRLLLQFPAQSQSKVGQTLKDLRSLERGIVKKEFDEQFNAFKSLTEQDAPEFNAKPLIDHIQKMVGDKKVAIDKSNLPSIFARVDDLQNLKSGKANLDDLRVIWEELGADIRMLKTNMSANPYALGQLKQASKLVDEILGKPTNVRDALLATKLRDLKNGYRDQYIERFMTGTNKQLDKFTSAGEPKILSEDLVQNYLKKEANMGRFMGAHSEDQAAMTSMSDGIIDLYRQKVIFGGVWNKSAHNVFIKQYGERGLKYFPELKAKLMDTSQRMSYIAKKMGEANGRLAEVDSNVLARTLSDKGVSELVPKALSNPRLMLELSSRLDTEGKKSLARHTTRLAFGDDALTADEVFNFINNNETSLKIAFRAAWGAKKAGRHLNNIKAIAEIERSIQKTGKPQVSAGEAQSGKWAQFTRVTGISSSMIWTAFRASGRQGGASPDYFAGVFAATALSKSFQNEVVAVQKRILTDPKYADDLLKSFADGKGKLELDSAKDLMLRVGGVLLGGGSRGAKTQLLNIGITPRVEMGDYAEDEQHPKNADSQERPQPQQEQQGQLK